MKQKSYLLTEFFILFILIPISFTISYPIWIKIVIATLIFIYIIAVLKKVERISMGIKREISWIYFLKRVAVIFVGIALITTAYVYFIDVSALFLVPRKAPLLFISILIAYSLFSVWPQEIIYRTFFCTRYARIFKNKSFLIFLSAIVFSLAHLFFKNTLVLVFTFIGGLLFAITYLKYKPTILVSIEHAIYGNWLFAVGMGQMLAFPSIEN